MSLFTCVGVELMSVVFKKMNAFATSTQQLNGIWTVKKMFVNFTFIHRPHALVPQAEESPGSSCGQNRMELKESLMSCLCFFSFFKEAHLETQ